MKLEPQWGKGEYRAHLPGYRLRMGRRPDRVAWWNVEAVNSRGHVKLVAQGWAKTIKEAKRLAEGFAGVHGGKR